MTVTPMFCLAIPDLLREPTREVQTYRQTHTQRLNFMEDNMADHTGSSLQL